MSKSNDDLFNIFVVVLFTVTLSSGALGIYSWVNDIDLYKYIPQFGFFHVMIYSFIMLFAPIFSIFILVFLFNKIFNRNDNDE